MAEPFDLTVRPDGIVVMRLVGTLNDTNLAILKSQVISAKKFVKAESEKRGAPVSVLFDLTQFTGTYNVEAMLLMKGLEEHNRPYTRRTAVFGGSAAAQVAAELTLELIGQSTLRLFPTQAEALVWLSAD